MRSALLLPMLIGLALSVPTPQLVDLVAIEASPAPDLVSAPLDVSQDTPPDIPAASIAPITTAVTRKRDVDIDKRDGNCAVQPTGSGPVPTPDTVDAFTAYPTFQAMATGAPTPDGYSSVFTNLAGSLSASNYMGLYTIKSYDTLGCASKCDQADGCQAFNMYIERDPSVDPNAVNCPNPPSITNYKCTLWGAPVVAQEATNTGQYRDSFQVVIAGSNGYNKIAPPSSIGGYNGPTELGGAINAPLDSKGRNTYMGYKYFPFSQSQGYDPQACADACSIQTGYNSRHPAIDGTYQTCIFFNAYVLSKNSIPQGLYCSLYNETWDRSYATNYGQYRGSDQYTVSRSYSYSLSNPPNPSTSDPKPCPADAVIQNGDFETGANPPTPWTISSVTGSTTSTIVSPGSTNNGGTYSFAASLAPSDSSNGASSLTLSQTMKTCGGGNYSIGIDYKFDTSPGACTIAIKYPFKNTQGSVTAPDNVSGTTAGQWTFTGSFFQAVSAADVFYVVFTCSNGVSNRVSIDNVVIKPFAGNAY